MGSLLKVEFRKLLQEKSMYVCLGIVMLMIGLPILAYAMDPAEKAPSFYNYLFLSSFSEGGVDMLLPILTALLICRDFSSGFIKVVVGRGYSRTKVYCAKFITTLAVTLLFALISWCTAALLISACFHYTVSLTGRILLILADQVLAMVLVGSISFLASMLFRKSAIAIAVSLILPLAGTIFVSLIDTLYKAKNFNLTDFWVWTFLTELSSDAVANEVMIRCAVVSVTCIAVIFSAGLVRFRKSDV